MSECRCGRPTRDDAYACDTCGDDLSRALAEVPWLDEQLDITLTRQKGVDYRRASNGTKATDRPSPVTWSASEARGHLKALLVSWALFCDAESIRNQSPTTGLPADNLPALSRYLLWRVDGLLLNDIGPEAVDEITSAVAHCHRLIDRPADRQYLGACAQDECIGRMYGRPTSTWARCDTCSATVDAEVIRKGLIGELEDRLCTAAEIAELSTYLGLKAGRQQVQKYVEYLGRKGRIEKHSAFSTRAVYRFGEVYAHLINRDYGRKAS